MISGDYLFYVESSMKYMSLSNMHHCFLPNKCTYGASLKTQSLLVPEPVVCLIMWSWPNGLKVFINVEHCSILKIKVLKNRFMHKK